MSRSKLTLVCFASILLVACSGKESQNYMENASQAVNEGKLSEAVVHLKNHLAENGSDPQARVLLGEVYFSQGEYFLAAKEFEKYAETTSLGKVDNRITPKLSKALFESESYQSLYTLADDVTPNSEYFHQIKFYEAVSYMRLGQLERVQDIIDKTKNVVAPDSSSSIYVELIDAVSYTLANDYQSAKLSAGNALDIEPENRDALELSGAISFQIGALDDAAKFYKQLYDIAPSDAESLLYYVVAQNRVNSSKDISVEVEKLYSRFPQSPIVNLLKAKQAFEDKDYAKSAELSEIASQSSFNLTEAKLIAGLSYVYLDKDENAYKHLSSIKTLLPNSHGALKLLAMLELKLGYLPEAKTSFHALPPLPQKDAELYALAADKLQEAGDSEGASEMIGMFSPYSESDANLQARLGSLQLSSDVDAAIKNLEEATNSGVESAEAKLSLAAGYLRAQQYEKLADMANKWAESEPSKIAPLNLAAKAYVSLGEKERAREYLEKALAIDENNPASLELLASDAIALENFDEAEVILTQLLNSYPSYFPGLVLYLSLPESVAPNGNKEQIASQSYSSNQTDIRYALLYAQTLALAKQPNKVRDVLAPFEDVSGSESYYLLYGDALVALGEFNGAQRVYRKWVNRFQNSKLAHMRLILSQDMMETWRAALTSSQNALSIWPDSDQFKILSANFYNYTSQPKQALQLLNSIEEPTSKTSAFKSVKGQSLFVLGDKEQGAELLKASLQERPNINAVMLLTKFYKEKLNWQELENTYQIYLEHKPNDLKMRLLLANDFLSKESALAKEQYELVLKSAPESIISIGNLAWIYYTEDNLTEAEKFAKKGLSIKPNSAEILDTLGLIETKREDFKLAVEYFNKALNETPNASLIALHKIDALMQAKSYFDADKALRKLEFNSDLKGSPVLINRRAELNRLLGRNS